MTKPKKKKDSLAWLEELVEAAKAWRASFRMADDDEVVPDSNSVEPHGRNCHALATAVDGYRQAITEEVEAEFDEEEDKRNGD